MGPREVRVGADGLAHTVNTGRRKMEVEHPQEVIGHLLVVNLVVLARFPKAMDDGDGGCRRRQAKQPDAEDTSRRPWDFPIA